jgi:murein DD-endopeptidase MepM/ murein hydrolase activator NlpD
MKNFYYFSKRKLKFVEIRNFKRRYILSLLLLSLLISVTIFGIYNLIDNQINPDSTVSALQSSNRELTNKLRSVSEEFEKLEKQVDILTESNDHLRLAVNLDPISQDQRKIGIGGSAFDEYTFSNNNDINSIVEKVDSYLNRISAKLNFESSNFQEIENTFKINQKLYDALPAIKPAYGPFGDRFGMRTHPILKIRRMHSGLDILVNTGNPVYAPGGGRVEFTGRRGGLGRTIEVDHKFGYKTLYGHLSKIVVKRGQKIKRGDLIGYSGNSGKLSTGPHLHYEIRHNGVALNPKNFIYEDVKLFDIISNDFASEE